MMGHRKGFGNKLVLLRFLVWTLGKAKILTTKAKNVQIMFTMTRYIDLLIVVNLEFTMYFDRSRNLGER